MNKFNSDTCSRLGGVTPFPDEPYELALALYESCNIKELINQLETDADESILREWNLTPELYREELLFAKLLLEND